MSDRKDFLIRHERKKRRSRYSWTSFTSNPHLDRVVDRLSCFIPVHIGQATSQFGRSGTGLLKKYADVGIKELKYTTFPRFRYQLKCRHEENEVSNPARSIGIRLPVVTQTKHCKKDSIRIL